ncbi:MAG: YchF family ATPase [Desulfobacterales bacterium]|nr:YchF family ATPase [Desulfobacterales bacterium]
MKLGIVGHAGAGKTTVFDALTGSVSETGRRDENRIGTIVVPDERIDILSDMYKPKKTIFAQVEYFLPGKTHSEQKKDQEMTTPIRDCDALIHVIKNFTEYGMEPPKPAEEIVSFDQELILSDLVIVEKRLERLVLDKKRGKKIDPEEEPLLEKCKTLLEDEKTLRDFPEIATAHVLRGFAFLSAKPMLVLLNNEDEDESLPDTLAGRSDCMVIRGKLEQEISRMSNEEAEEFLQEFNITSTARDRVITRSYDLLGLISFFTVGEDEVRAWTIKKDTPAVDAAEVIHSDIKKGFIRAEVLAYDDLMSAGDFLAAKKVGTVRLEGKTYIVQNGDIVHYRFNV